MKFIAVLFVPVLVLAPSIIAHAQEKSEPGPLEEIVVEATRAKLTVLDIPANTSVLSERDVADFISRTPDDILRQVPGFSLLRSADSIATAPSTSTVSLRGLGGNASSRALVLLDGIPMHSPVGSEVYWARIPKHQVEKIEVIRGGGANAWGNLAMTGVINITTRPASRNGLALSAILSNPTTVDIGVAGSQVTDSWDLSGQVSYFDTEGYYNVPADERAPVDRRVKKKYTTASGRAAYRINENSEWFFTGSLMGEERNAGTPRDNDETDIWTVGTGFVIEDQAGGRWNANLFYEEMDQQDFGVRIINDGEDDAIRQLRDQPTSVVGSSLVWSANWSQDHELTAGIDYRWSDITINEFDSYVDEQPNSLRIIDASQDMGGIFIQDVWQLSKSWQLNASLRYDRFSNQGNAVNTVLPGGQQTGSENYPKNTESSISPNLGLLYRINNRMSVRAAAYKSFRAPTLRELYRSASTRGGNVLVNNPFLQAEHLVGLEAGLDLNLSPSTLLRFTLFQNTVEDLIQNMTRGVAEDQPVIVPPCGVLQPGQTCLELDNVGEMQATGLEVEADIQLSQDWSIFLSYLYNDTEITQAPDNPSLIGNQVRQSPKSSFTARVRYDGRWFSTSLVGRYVGDRFEDAGNTLPVDDYTVVDLRLSKSLSDTTDLFLTVANLFDKAYEVQVNNNGFTETGRPRFVGIGINYRR